MSTPSNASNAAVRAVLRSISKQYGTWSDADQEATLQYFNNCCAYSGVRLERDAKGKDWDWDHATPENVEHCGLTIKGNMLPVTKAKNSEKGGKMLYSEFLQGEPEKLKAIQDFRREAGYPEGQDLALLKARLSLLYAATGALVRAAIKECNPAAEVPEAADGRTSERLLRELDDFIRREGRRPRCNAPDAKEKSLANRCSTRVCNAKKKANSDEKDTALIARWKEAIKPK